MRAYTLLICWFSQGNILRRIARRINLDFIECKRAFARYGQPNNTRRYILILKTYYKGLVLSVENLTVVLINGPEPGVLIGFTYEYLDVPRTWGCAAVGAVVDDNPIQFDRLSQIDLPPWVLLFAGDMKTEPAVLDTITAARGVLGRGHTAHIDLCSFGCIHPAGSKLNIVPYPVGLVQLTHGIADIGHAARNQGYTQSEYQKCRQSIKPKFASFHAIISGRNLIA
jgi:hypothetical protein